MKQSDDPNTFKTEHLLQIHAMVSNIFVKMFDVLPGFRNHLMGMTQTISSLFNLGGQMSQDDHREQLLKMDQFHQRRYNGVKEKASPPAHGLMPMQKQTDQHKR